MNWIAKLGQADKGRLEQNLTSVREFEIRTERVDKWLDVPRPKVAPADRSKMNRSISLKQLGDYLRTMCGDKIAMVTSMSFVNPGVVPADGRFVARGHGRISQRVDVKRQKETGKVRDSGGAGLLGVTACFRRSSGSLHRVE